MRQLLLKQNKKNEKYKKSNREKFYIDITILENEQLVNFFAFWVYQYFFAWNLYIHKQYQ
jgi:hypothetical protein